MAIQQGKEGGPLDTMEEALGTVPAAAAVRLHDLGVPGGPVCPAPADGRI